MFINCGEAVIPASMTDSTGTNSAVQCLISLEYESRFVPLNYKNRRFTLL